MRPVLTLAHSPDPDDAFMWWPITGKVRPDGTPVSPSIIDTGRFDFRAVPADIEVLNRRAAEVGDLDITAISFRNYCDIKERYAITASGSSFGDGFGPKVVARQDQSRDTVKVNCEGCLRSPRVTVAVPGRRTTAFLVLSMVLADGAEANADATPRIVEMPFDQIIPAVAAGRADAGVVIHEGQLLYEQAGLRLVLDLGAWWKSATGLPLPLGANAVKRDLDSRFGAGTMREVSATLRRSIEHALAHRDESIEYTMPFALANFTRGGKGEAPSPQRVDRYIEMYVNTLTLEMGVCGRAAVVRLLRDGAAHGLCPDPGDLDIV